MRGQDAVDILNGDCFLTARIGGKLIQFMQRALHVVVQHLGKMVKCISADLQPL